MTTPKTLTLLVGRPGSGKSHHAGKLGAGRVTIPAKAGAAFSTVKTHTRKALKSSDKHIIIDRTNPRLEQRAELFKMAKAAGFVTILTWIDSPRILCETRLPGRTVDINKVVGSFEDNFVEPTAAEADQFNHIRAKEEPPPENTANRVALLEKALVLLITCQSADAATAAAASKLGLTDAEAAALIKAARLRLAAIASYDLTEQLGRSIARLNDLYQRSIAFQDAKTGLAVVKELNRLLALGDAGPNLDHLGAGEELQAVDAYLRPLQLATAATSTAELARLAALRLADHGPPP